LKATDRQALMDKRAGGRPLSGRRWRRIRILELLDKRWKLTQTAAAVGTYPREVRRVGWRYLERGLEAALTDDPRPKPEKMLNAKQQAAIVAMVCGPAPPGHARWTIVLTAREARRRGLVQKVGRETIRRLFVSHELKPWREKNVVRAHPGPGIRRADGGGAGGAEPTAR
jgi:putative transposase